MADKLIAIRDGFFSDDEEDFCDPTIWCENWTPGGPEARAEVRVAHAKGEVERIARRAAIEAEFARDDAETARRDAEDAIKWAPFLEERAKLKNEEEALFDRAEALDRQWERLVIDRETWGQYRAVREETRREELCEAGEVLIADQEAWWERWDELVAKVETAWAKRRPK